MERNVKIGLMLFLLMPLLLLAEEVQSQDTVETDTTEEKATLDAEQLSAIKLSARKFIKEAELLEERAQELRDEASDLDYAEEAFAIKEMRAKAEYLQDRAELLRERAEELYESAEELESPEKVKYTKKETRSDNERRREIRERAMAIKDTIQLYTREGVKALLDGFRGKKRSTRERGYGGGCGPVVSMHAINLDPVKELIPSFPLKYAGYRQALSSIGGSYENFLLMGGLGYGAIGNGIRIGGGGRGGSRSYSVLLRDTTWITEVSVGYGGFLAEKCFVHGDMNWFVGGMIGGGNISVTPSYSTGVFDVINEDDFSFNKLKTNFMLLELHSGFTYTLVNWFHIGTDIAVPFFLAPDGFKNSGKRSLTNGFMNVNPGIRIRFILGNIG